MIQPHDDGRRPLQQAIKTPQHVSSQPCCAKHKQYKKDDKVSNINVLWASLSVYYKNKTWRIQYFLEMG